MFCYPPQICTMAKNFSQCFYSTLYFPCDIFSGSQFIGDLVHVLPPLCSLLATSKGLSKINGAKFIELSQNFPILADWAVHLQVKLLGRTGGGNFQTGNISFAQPCTVFFKPSPPVCVSEMRQMPSFSLPFHDEKKGQRRSRRWWQEVEKWLPRSLSLSLSLSP